MKQIKCIFGTLFVVIAFLVFITPPLAVAGKNKAEPPAANAPVIFEAIEDGAGNLDIVGSKLVVKGLCPEIDLAGVPIPTAEIGPCSAGDPDMVTIRLPGGELGSFSLVLMTKTGTNRFEVAFGTQGEKGEKGETGDTGPQGSKGDKGDTGPQGPKGDKGDTGPQGLKGNKGDTGPRGPAGADGTDGNDGADGAIQYTGIAPIDVDNPAQTIGLNAATNVGDLLTWDGNNWIARQPATPSATVDNMQPFLGINFQIALFGIFPSRSGAEPFIGEIMMVGWNFAARGFALCDGQLLSISQNEALFSLLGTTYGGDGRTTFGLPDLRGRVPLHIGRGPGLTPRPLGQRGGAERHTHTH